MRAASPAIPARRAAGGGDAISSHTPADTHPSPATRPPPAARSPAQTPSVPDRRSRALRLPARLAHRRLPQPGTPLAAAGARLRDKPPRPPAPPHNMASLGFRNGVREIQQGPLNIHERLRGSRLGRRCGEGGKERASGRAEAPDGDGLGVRAPPRAGFGGATPPPRPAGRPRPPRPPRGRRSPRATPRGRRRYLVGVLPSACVVLPLPGSPMMLPRPADRVWVPTAPP